MALHVQTIRHQAPRGPTDTICFQILHIWYGWTLSQAYDFNYVVSPALG